MAERSVRTAADGSVSISDVIVSGIIGTPIEPVSARISALTLAQTAGRDFAAGMTFGKLVFGAGRFPEGEERYLGGAGWSFDMLVAWDHSYRLMFSASSGSAVIYNTNTFESHSAALGDFSFDAATRTAAGPFGAATTVNIRDNVTPLWEAGFYSGFRAVGAGADLSAWFLNLPAGLSAAAEAAAEGALSAGFAFSGTPQAAALEEIEAEVPLAVQPNENAVFAIRDEATSTEIYDVTVAGYAD